MRRLILCLALLMVVSTIPMAMADDDHNRSHRVRTHLSGFNEVHFAAARRPSLRGAVSTAASGKFVAEIDEQGQKIHYKLSYKDLEGEVTQGTFTLVSGTRLAASWSGSVRRARTACSSCRRCLNALLSC